MSGAEKKVRAIVTRAVPYKESDMIVTLVSIEEGKITATARGCLKPKAKLRYAAEIMNFGDYVLTGKNGHYIITECSQIESFTQITYDLEKFYSASLILEILQKVSIQPQPKLFLKALEKLQKMAFENMDAYLVVTQYLLDILDENGSHLDFSHCNICKSDLLSNCAFSISNGIVCNHCQNFDTIPIDNQIRQYLSGEKINVSSQIKTKANMLLSSFVYQMIGIKISNHYFTELL